MVINFICWLAILAVLIVSVEPNNVYYVTTNSSNDNNSKVLKHYLDNPKKYFISDSKLIFLPGEYQLNVDLVFQNIRNFTVTAINPCKIYCSSNTSILVVNVTKFEFQSLNLINCGKNHTTFIYQRNPTNNFSLFSEKNYAYYNYNSSILFYHCAVVRIFNVNISVGVYFGGIIAMNVNKSLMIDSVKVQLECSDYNSFKYPIAIEAFGVLLQYKMQTETIQK